MKNLSLTLIALLMATPAIQANPVREAFLYGALATRSTSQKTTPATQTPVTTAAPVVTTTPASGWMSWFTNKASSTITKASSCATTVASWMYNKVPGVARFYDSSRTTKALIIGGLAVTTAGIVAYKKYQSKKAKAANAASETTTK